MSLNLRSYSFTVASFVMQALLLATLNGAPMSVCMLTTIATIPTPLEVSCPNMCFMGLFGDITLGGFCRMRKSSSVCFRPVWIF